jgi:2-polyprenyl-6-methoxyphenol hydroxylase-like FAD-dependent oxidoreductase
MFSAVRKTLHPKDGFRPMPWVTCNFRLSASFTKTAVGNLGADPLGINVFYGTGWSAALTPTRDGAYVALTVPSPIKDVPSALAFLPDSPLIQAIRADANSDKGRAFPLYSAKHTQVGRGRLILIGDAARGMNPFCGAGASMALNDADSLVKVLTGTEGMSLNYSISDSRPCRRLAALPQEPQEERRRHD